MLSVKQGGIKYHFWVFGMTRPGIKTLSPGQLANTLSIKPGVKITLTFLPLLRGNTPSKFSVGK